VLLLMRLAYDADRAGVEPEDYLDWARKAYGHM